MNFRLKLKGIDKIKDMHAAFIQMSCFPGETAGNRQKAEVNIKQAAVEGAELIVLPELFNVGYDLDLLKKMNYNFQEEKEYYLSLSAKEKVCLACGLLESEDDKLYNSLYVFSHGDLIARYRKNNLFPLSRENEIFERGKESVTFDLAGFKFGLTICYDIRFPELFRKYADQGCHGIIVSSAFPFPRLEHWLTLLKSQAILNQVYIIASNRTGKDSGFWFVGNSCIIDPWGSVLNSMDEIEEGSRVSYISKNRVDEIRKIMPSLYDRQKQYSS